MRFDINDFQKEVDNQFAEFIGLDFEDICYKMNLNPELMKNKASVVNIMRRMMDHKGLSKKDLNRNVIPYNLSLKTVRLQANGVPKESMSFENVNFMQMVNETWKTSRLRMNFSRTVFLFFVFQYIETGFNKQVLVFRGIKAWKMPVETLDNHVKEMWEKTRDIVINGVEFNDKPVGNKIYKVNNLPSKANSKVAHIRPKAKDSNDKIELPDGQLITKQGYWLNNDYIASILTDMPNVILRSIEKSTLTTDYSINQIERLRNSLELEIYPIEDFILKVNKIIPGFNEMDINDAFLKRLGYKLDKNFIILEKELGVDEYIEKIVFNERYFQIPKESVFSSQYIKRKLDNLENDYRLLKIEDDLFITNNVLKDGGITKETLINYKEEVEDYVKEGHFFTYKWLKKNGFTTTLEDYGFEDIFYESILMRPGRLKYLRINNQKVFVKTKYEVTLNDFVKFILGEDTSISIDEMIEKTQQKCNLNLDYDYAIQLMKKTHYFYSQELLKLYEDKEVYYQDIYK